MLEILVGAIANLLTRFLPLLFLRKHAQKFLFLKDEFPTVLLTILTLYLLFPQEINFHNLKYQLISLIVAMVFHLLFRRFLLSIFVGSFLYIYFIN